MTDIAERYALAEALLPAKALRHAYGWFVKPEWIGRGGQFWYRVRRREGLFFVQVDPQTQTARPAFDHMRLAAALSAYLGETIDAAALPMRDIAITDAGVRFEIGARAFHYDPVKGLRSEPFSGEPNSLVAPCGRRAVVLRDHNLHLLENDAERPLTTDGALHFGWGEEPGGTMDALSDAPARPAAEWSPCGRWLVVFRCDERAVAEMPILDHAPSGGQPPRTHALRVPLIGAGSTETASYWIIDTLGDAQTRIDIPPFAAMESPFWFARQGLKGPEFWTPDSLIMLTRRHTGGRGLTLYRVDPCTGAAVALIEEHSEVPVRLNAFEFGQPVWRVLPRTGEILWYSERDGWGQVYLHEADGAFRHRIGAGHYALRDLLGVDEDARHIWFTAHGVCPSGNPYNRHLMRASLDGGPARVLTREPVEHVVWSDPGGRYFVDLMGAPDQPSRSVLRDREGVVILMLEQADADDLFAIGYRPPERATVLAADGETALQAAIFLPPDFDPTRRYPVLDAIYGWSQVTVVPHGFLLDTGGPLDGGIEIAAENALLPAATAALGFVVVVIDGRGTPYRNRAFLAPAFDDPAMATGLADHAAAIRTLAEDRPWMDLSRVGIFGHSGGGHMAAKAMMLHGDLFRAGVASAGCHDMRIYHGAWADLWGMTPEMLARSAVPPLVERLQGALLLAHGDMDENVHAAHTLQMAQALIAANKDFDLLILPGRHHDFTLDPYFLRRRWDFLIRHVMGETPPVIEKIDPGDWRDVT